MTIIKISDMKTGITHWEDLIRLLFIRIHQNDPVSSFPFLTLLRPSQCKSDSSESKGTQYRPLVQPVSPA